MTESRTRSDRVSDERLDQINSMFVDRAGGLAHAIPLTEFHDLTLDLVNARRDRAEMRAVLEEIDACSGGRDADGAPAGDGTYWLGHGTALRVWFTLHPETLPDAGPNLDF